ncbi:hypothetical protein CROQUDRAFT_97871 [Cronartium quercuum f. sp. fusiforme G11]|uniref:Structural maintenance of chromosomes protein n=1 Tax=Cronartium quercuum f. sp. fusiforme G11 TaxID=708437 RepID=A0A9P6NA45_9BASI|nr:hypothetical protein CROQUDRAFT_97871 [Cronartium quercuum f. sp. fusiforme G11]
MFIKSLTIQGFKSYRDATTIENFSPGVNVVVGRNGSGKSNFFSAIRFLLNDQYNTLGRDERQSLLHEGSDNNTTFSAFVEATFDNSDHRFPTGKNQVIIRRTIGSKKDEYSLDKKSTPKGEIMSLLESAGFSKSNPYYIVPQGRITHLTNIKDSERLDLLKEVAGTQVYEDRRTESVKIMDDTSSKRVKIDELLEYIETRLNELDEEKEELKEYNDKDRERRCLEYGIYSRELDEANTCLVQLEETRRNEIQDSNLRRAYFEDRDHQITQLEIQLSAAKRNLETLEADKLQSETERREYIKARTQVECLLKDSDDLKGKDDKIKKKLENELTRIQAEIILKERELSDVTPKAEAKATEVNECTERLAQIKSNIDALYAKQGRANLFRTQKERDAHLKSEITKLQGVLKSAEDMIRSVSIDVNTTKQSLAEIEARSQEIRKTLDQRKRRLLELKLELSEMREEHNKLTERRKVLWKDETKIALSMQNAASMRDKAIKDLNMTMDRNTAQGLEVLERIMKSGNFPGVYGPLYSLFDVDDYYKIAVEATAGNSLFHIVVDTDETASHVLEIMANEKKGRCTFIPLNRLRPKEYEYPEREDGLALIRKIHYDQVYHLAFQQVFAKTIVCRNLEIAGAYVRTHQLNAITLDGDKVDKKGSITGGYQQSNRSRLDCVKQVKEWKEKYNEEAARLRDTKRAIRDLDQAITELVGKIKNSESELKRREEEREPLTHELMELMEDELTTKKRLALLESHLQNQKTDVINAKIQIDLHEKEMKSKMTNTLSDEEFERINALTTEMESLKEEVVRMTQEKGELSRQKSALEFELKEKLYRTREEVKEKLEDLNASTSSSQVGSRDSDARRRELDALDRSIEQNHNHIENILAEIELANRTIQQIESNLDKLQAEQAEDTRDTSKHSKNLERYWAKKKIITQRRDECNTNIRNLGVLPQEAYEKYTEERTDRLVRALHKVNESLKKFAHVNKKAFEQYQNFTEQRDKLTERREELERSAESITELIEVLDQRKDEAIERTFKQVSKNFSDVFQKLVPLGRGRLIMQKRLDDQERGDDSSGGEAVQSAGLISQYTGVSIKVSFNSKEDEGLRIQQLSGGQKSLVALATIFAIQKCDPAPFYLFDEIDANLDPDRRTSVAAMIGELGKEAQMICTTFRPEMLEHADLFLGVIFNNRKISTIQEIEKTHAKQFVESNERGPAPAAPPTAQ